MRFLNAGAWTASAILLSGSALAATPLHEFHELAVSADGKRVATVEYDTPADPAAEPVRSIVLRQAGGGGTAVQVSLPCMGSACVPSALAFAPDGSLAFVLKEPKEQKRFVFRVGADGKNAKQLLAFDGTLQDLSFSKDGTLAVLATAGAHKEPGATSAGAKQTGEIGENEDEQRIATIAGGTLHWQSPADLYVYEYDWRSGDGDRFVGTAAHGNGDNNYWVAKLYGFADGKAQLLFSPPQREQLARPTVSPDGHEVAFIGGIMSDFGSVGGDAYRLALDTAKAEPVDLTPGLHATISNLSYRCGGGLTGSALAGSKVEYLALGGGDPRTLWSGETGMGGGGWSFGVACGGGTSASVKEDFATAPELLAGPVGQWRTLTHVNAGKTAPVVAQSVTWHNDQFDLQGWLLSPKGAPSGAGAPKSAMIVSVHGGPSAAQTPHFLTERRGELALLKAGYRIFLPNPRGSFGQGEAFTQANVRDFGHGDLRDVLTGIDAVEKIAPVDDARLGLTGYSYGGYMTMWTVTQTNRFKAAVAGAGISDWKSYYGENGIDEWMIPFFGASVYDDPAIYAKSSPIEFIKQVKTPTFEFVGDADVECPMPQTQEFYHALRTFGVPTEFVVYPGQGHGMADPKARADATRRTIAWFDRYLSPGAKTATN